MKEVFVFPHCSIPEDLMNLVSQHFHLNICKPWYMEVVEKDARVFFPKEELKPPEYFLNLLQEFKNWMMYQDKGNVLFMIAEKEVWDFDETPSHIKALIKGKKKEKDKVSKTLKWHLILHLATEFELSQYEIDSTISNLSKKESPLQAAVEDAGLLDPMFRDISDSRTDPILDERVMLEIATAWIMLFKDYVPKDSFLFTFNKGIFFLLKSQLENFLINNMSKKQEIPVKEEKIGSTSLLQLNFPALIGEKDLISEFLSEKRLLCI